MNVVVLSPIDGHVMLGAREAAKRYGISYEGFLRRMKAFGCCEWLVGTNEWEWTWFETGGEQCA